MSFQFIVFNIFAVLMLLAALRVITSRNPVHAALSLVLAFVCGSVLWLILEAEFLAITLVLVYVGAVMVLFLFVVMMLDINVAIVRKRYAKYLPVGLLIGVALFVQMAIIIIPERFGVIKEYSRLSQADADYSNTTVLGQALYTDYLYPLEIAAAILLVAIIAAIALTMRRRPETKYQNPSEQVVVRKQDRLKIVKMESEQEQ